MADRMAECQNLSQNICQKKCQIECQRKYQYRCPEGCQIRCQNRCQIEWQEIIPYIFPDDMSETMTNKCQGGDHLKKSVFFAGTSGFKPRNMGVLTCFN
jgi:hypothetical protein